MLGNLYDRALDGERCWIRRDDGEVRNLPVRSGSVDEHADGQFDDAVVGTVQWPDHRPGLRPRTIGDRTRPSRRSRPRCRPVRDRSRSWLGAAARQSCGAMCSTPCPLPGRWQTVLLADGNVGLGGDPLRVLRRAAELLRRGGHCIAEFEPVATGIRTGWVRLESSRTIGPWFRWASVGIDCAAELAEEAGLGADRTSTDRPARPGEPDSGLAGANLIPSVEDPV